MEFTWSSPSVDFREMWGPTNWHTNWLPMCCGIFCLPMSPNGGPSRPLKWTFAEWSIATPLQKKKKRSVEFSISKLSRVKTCQNEVSRTSRYPTVPTCRLLGVTIIESPTLLGDLSPGCFTDQKSGPSPVNDKTTILRQETGYSTLSGWWLSHPSEKYESVGMIIPMGK